MPLEEAWQLIASEVAPLGSQSIPFDQSAGRVLASEIVAADDYPAFDKAMMDGFAVRAEDCAEAGADLAIRGLVSAGSESLAPVAPGEAIRINTGAPMPAGANAVVRVEDTLSDDDTGRVTIRIPATAGRHVAARASTRSRGDLLLAPPLRLGAAQLAAIATAGIDTVDVFPEIQVAIMPTGDELVPVGAERRPGQIFESNGPMLSALMRQFSANAVDIGIIADEESSLRSAMLTALAHPVVISVGGMSMGTHDLVPDLFASLGVEWKFHGVLVRPGKPVAYGRGPDGQHVFGLPGNPVSAFVCSWLFVQMVVGGLSGFPVHPPVRWRATLTRDIDEGRDTRPAFVPARLWSHPATGIMTEPCGWSGSADPFGLALANGLLFRETPAALSAGDEVDVIPVSSGSPG